MSRAFACAALLLVSVLSCFESLHAKSLPERPCADPEPRVSEPGQPKSEGRSCALDAASNDPEGLYSRDAFPAGEVVLTFDDGPHPSTPKVLDLLKKHGFHATFFLVGHNISAKTQAVIQRMVAEGHTLGSHSYNHDVKMSERDHGARTVEYIRGQHETTQILVEMALMAQSESDFDSMFTRVFREKPGTWLAAGSLRRDWRSFVERHREVLAERGYANGARPYPILYSRPPGGGPYLGLSSSAQKRPYTTALEQLGWLNVMWHGASGDTVPGRRYEYGYLTQNLAAHSRRGGVILIHDYIRKDALGAALAQMARDPRIRVVPIAQAAERKLACDRAR